MTSIAHSFTPVAAPGQRPDDTGVRLRDDVTAGTLRTALDGAALCLPEVDERALTGLKFAAALPGRLATATLAARLSDLDAATAVLHEPVRWTSQAS